MSDDNRTEAIVAFAEFDRREHEQIYADLAEAPTGVTVNQEVERPDADCPSDSDRS